MKGPKRTPKAKAQRPRPKPHRGDYSRATARTIAKWTLKDTM